MLDRIFRRLQLLHWESRGDGHVELPLLSRTLSQKLDSSDPEVFWVAADHLLGREVQQALMALPWQTALFIACQLRGDGVWVKFLETYHVIVDTVDRHHTEFANMMTAKIRATYPTQLDTYLSMRPDKWTVLSWVFHVASWFAGIPQGWALAIRIGSAGLALKKMWDHQNKVVNTYHDSDRKLIASRVKSMIADATKTK